MNEFVRTYAFDASLQRAENIVNHPGVDKILLRSKLTRGDFGTLPEELRISAASVEIVVNRFSPKSALLAKISEAIQYFAISEVVLSKRSQVILAAASFPSYRVVLKIGSQRDLKNFERWVRATTNLRFSVLVDSNLLTSRSIVDSLLTYSVPVLADQVEEVEQALELKSWGVSEIVSPHISVLNAI